MLLAMAMVNGCTAIWKPKPEDLIEAIGGMIFDFSKLPSWATSWGDDIVKAGSICPESPPQLIAAQLQQESTFGLNTNKDKPWAVAFGPAQFTPATWAVHGVDGDGDGDRDIWDPADAIASQGSYNCKLAGIVRPLGGDTQALMLAAYNAGPGAVQKYNGIPPYKETTNYVRVIQANMKNFEKPGGTAAGTRAQGAIAVAMEYVKAKTPYLWGGTTLKGIDCSALVQNAYEAVGVELPRVAQDQINAFLPTIPASQVRPGDLVGFDTSGSSGGSIKNITHIGLVSAVSGSNIQMIEAPVPGKAVRIAQVNTMYANFTPFYVRVPGSDQPVAGTSNGKSDGKWVLPVNVRYSPTYKAAGPYANRHTGIDFPAKAGTDIKAVGPGKVVTAGWGGAYGWQVVIKHDDGKYTQYAHMNGRPRVGTGARVSAGQVIGDVGSTGNSTGPHLHFEARTGPEYGSDIDPVGYLRSKGLSPQPNVAQA
ncbi:MAG TPA: peptidoglycan DD-metalloendopeptidase family protein [Yinghuangia sp.]|nr:peptidoglycan DD-metalloendopeptidase family protein [Yinghuangia sp.]